MKLYIIRAWNDVGGGIGTYHVVAPGINKAKAALRESDPIIKKVEVIEERKVIIVSK